MDESDFDLEKELSEVSGPEEAENDKIATDLADVSITVLTCCICKEQSSRVA